MLRVICNWGKTASLHAFLQAVGTETEIHDLHCASSIIRRRVWEHRSDFSEIIENFTPFGSFLCQRNGYVNATIASLAIFGKKPE
jgi:hypothetical protein